MAGGEITLQFWRTNIANASSGNSTSRDQTVVRSLLQRRTDNRNNNEEFSCQLTEKEIDDIFDAGSRRWTVDDQFLKEISHDLQKIVNCSREGDVVLLDVTTTVRPPRRITLPHDLTLRSSRTKTGREGSTSAKRQRKTRFECPPGSGVLLLRTPNALLADVAFEGCSLEGDDQAIVEVDECDAETSDGVIELRSVAFRRNALNGASAFSSRRSNCSSVEMVGVEFSGNTCGEACFARLSSASHLRKVVLSENVPVDAPRHTSALSLLHAASRSSTTVVGLNFSRNEIPGLHVTNGTLKLSSSFFVANSEGPLVRVESDSEAKIVNCSFDKNGNSNLRTETGHQKRTKRDEDSVLVGGQTSVMRGSAVSSIGGSARVRNCKFTDNQVRGDAGGLFASGGSLEIDNCTFKRNAATYSGGAIYVKETSVDISQLTCVSNSADNGGCLYAEDIWGYITHADISDNSARNGGGMCIVKSSVLGLEKTEVNANSTQSSGDVGAKRRPSFLCDTCVFKRNEAELAGGAIYANVSNLQRLVHHFDDCRFENNRAHLGGGIFLTGSNSTGNCHISSDDCTTTVVSGSILKHNVAEMGGALFANDPTAVNISCSQENTTTHSSDPLPQSIQTLTSLDAVCSSWTSNNARRYGNQVASYAEKTIWCTEEKSHNNESRWQQIEGYNHSVCRHRSGDPLPSIRLQMVDAFDQGPAVNADDALVRVVMWSEPQDNALFPGNVTMMMTDGTAEFSQINGLQLPGNYVIRIDYSEAKLPGLKIDVNIRSCIIGEEKSEDRKLCVQCPETQYNFLPEDSGCKDCPAHANCKQRNVIQPENNYWHDHPCSTHMQQCLSPEACVFDRRASHLANLTKDIEDCNVDLSITDQYAEGQCHKGYGGPLCGDCKAGYGQTTSFNCERCRRDHGIVYVVLSVLAVLGLSSFAIKSSLAPVLSATRNMAVLLRAMPARKKIRKFTDPLDHRREKSDGSSMVVHAQSIQSFDIEHSDSSREEREKEAELAKSKIVEIFKITINFLQVVAVAVNINTNWTTSAKSLISATDAVGGMLLSTASFSVECLAPSGSLLPSCIVRPIVSIAIPVAAVLLYGVFWMSIAAMTSKNWEYVKKRSMLSFLAISYLTYVFMTKTAVNILHCIQIHEFANVDWHSRSSRWSQATTVKCYGPFHAPLAITLGWPVLIAFTIGFPLFMSWKLLKSRNAEYSRESWFMDSTAFFYRAYADKFIYWESLVLARKALLTIVVAMGHDLGSNLQTLLAVCILTTALYIQTASHPFRPEFASLNQYEEAALFVSNGTFVLALFFNDDRLGHVVRVLLSMLFFVLICGLFCFLIFVFLRATSDYMRIVLGIEGVSRAHELSDLRVFFVFLDLKAAQKVPNMRRFLRAAETDLETDSNA